MNDANSPKLINAAQNRLHQYTAPGRRLSPTTPTPTTLVSGSRGWVRPERVKRFFLNIYFTLDFGFRDEIFNEKDLQSLFLVSVVLTKALLNLSVYKSLLTSVNVYPE